MTQLPDDAGLLEQTPGRIVEVRSADSVTVRSTGLNMDAGPRAGNLRGVCLDLLTSRNGTFETSERFLRPAKLGDIGRGRI